MGLISIERLSTFLSDLRNLFATITRVAGIEEKIPTQASSSNQLADKNFVNSSVQTATANFRGAWEELSYVPKIYTGYPEDYAGNRKPAVNDYMVVTNVRKGVPVWEQGQNYSAGSLVADDDDATVWMAKSNIVDSQIPPSEDTENWGYLSGWYDAWYDGGTWRFKYTGNWDTNGILGWRPEYQVNEEPLTAAQVAALNSNITAELTTKLQNLPSKPVDTASQSLTDGEKTQARTNIGAASSSDVTSLSGRVANVEEKIPTQASAQNQLADKNFVNSSIQTQTAHFRGNYGSVAELPLTGAGYDGTPTNNDYMVIQDTTGKLTHEPSPWYDETGAYVAGEMRIADDGMGVVKFYLCLADNDYDDPQPPATSPTYWEWLEDWDTISGGTWRFKYSGVWSVNGVKGWRPEYQVNEEPLTAAQIAALNSNITEALTNKLVALPSKPVDTAAQTLTEAEKLQARTNIGATAPEVFWAVYGSTTHAEVAAAVSAGKVVMMRYNNKDYHLATSDTASNFYFSYLYTDLLYSIFLSTGDVWGAENYVRVQQVANLVTSWQSTPDNSHYPSEKLVKDSIDAADKVFWAIYNSTDYATAIAAFNSEKVVLTRQDDDIYIGFYVTGNSIRFESIVGSRQKVLVLDSNGWASGGTATFQTTANKVTSLSASSTDNQYPSAKAVYDELQDKQPLIDSSHKLDYSLLDNTPTIPAAQVQSDWNQSDNTQADFIKNKPTIPAAQVQSDWNEADTNSKAYIQNKPTIPTVPTISTDIKADKTDNTKTASPKAVYDAMSEDEEVTAAALCELEEKKLDKDKLVDTYNSYVANAHEKAASAYALYDFYRTITGDLLADEEILATALNKLNALGILASAIAPLYKAGTRTFAVDDCCIYESQFYRCTTAVTSPEPFDPTKWERTNLFTEMVRRFNAL